jgi:hypothetical protein
MNQPQTKTAEFAIRAASLLLLAAGGALIVNALSVMSESTVSLLTGAAFGALVAFPCGALAMWVLTRSQAQLQRPQPPAPTAPELYEQGRRELVIDLEHRIASHVLDGSWHVVSPGEVYEPWRVITPRELVVMANEERRHG